MTNVTVPYPELGVAAFDQLDTWLQSFLLAGSDPELLAYSSLKFEQGQTLAAHTVVGFNARRRLVPATLSSIVTHHFVESATIANAGTGGTNGAAVVTGTTGTGTKFQANVTIAGGVIASVDSIAVEGDYTVAPTTPAAEPVTGGNLTGATLNLVL